MFLPLNLRVERRLCVIIGAGAIAKRKCCSLLEHGASVRVVAAEIKPCDLWRNEHVELIERPYDRQFLCGSLLTIAATDVPEINMTRENGVLMRPCPRFVVAGTASGTGKTSAALGLVCALKRRGLRVRTFKVGPDFLYPSYLTLASGRPCYNLDGWMCGRDYVEALFTRAVRDADIAVIEGVMGLFDGAGAASLSGSTVEIATWLNAPVLLVASAEGAARSVAATVYGFAHFERGVRIGGVVVNHCGSTSHAELLTDALRAAGLPPLLGSLADDSLPVLPSRHLGLVTADARFLTDETLCRFARALEKQVSVDSVL